jgi:type IV fimbrial biogenesis protein FimT
MFTQKGFSLIEVLCVLCITSILITAGTPAFSNIIKGNRSRNLSNQLFRIIQYTRSKAAFLREDVILCPSDDSTTCINNWNIPLIVFVDLNRNKKRDADEKIDQTTHLNKANSSINLTWRASGTSRYLRFISDGSTASQNGSFRICPKDGELAYIKKIILYRSGRAREALKKEITEKDCMK